MRLAREREQLSEYGRRIVDAGLVVGAAGNLSVRSGELIAVSPSGVRLDAIDPAACPVLDLRGNVVAAAQTPSSETPMHLACYAATGAGAVVHTHSEYGVVVSVTATELPPVHYYTLLLGGVVRVARYATYGTPEFAAGVQQALEGRHAALLANHGCVAVGDDLAGALDRAVLLEWLCRVYVQAKAIGEPRLLSDAELGDVAVRLRAPAWKPTGRP